MASENSDEHKTLEERITKLKQDVDQYNKQDDNIKVQQADMYNQLVTEKESCDEIITKYKHIMTSEPKKKKITVCDDKMFNKYMEQVHEIKLKLEQNIPLEEMIELYTKFNDAKVQIDAFLNNKKMTVKTI